MSLDCLECVSLGVSLVHEFTPEARILQDQIHGCGDPGGRTDRPMACIVTRFLSKMAVKSLPGWPSWLPSIGRPRASVTSAALIRNCWSCVFLNALLGRTVAVWAKGRTGPSPA